ncbi:hypothetical protein V6N12_000546 [Hibiscus sabdariffa]|uniref:RNase H type-1 domain-containing protein n=1 Tax=Hibiscus sabdariffa TaxID=183260 RepID=A0ABR2AJ21_9ROSI
MFIWLLLKQRLMTNEERCRRGFSFDASWGVLRNTTGTWICGYQKCVVQSDSSHAIKLLLDSSTNDHSMLLVRAIGILRQGSLHVDFQWIPREMNMVADCLSKLLPPPQFCLLVTSDIPEAAKSLLDRDREGPSLQSQ